MATLASWAHTTNVFSVADTSPEVDLITSMMSKDPGFELSAMKTACF